MYSFESRVRYSEVDANGRMTLESILDYFQDCSTFHSEDLGLGIAYLAERSLAWVLSSWQIDVVRYPVFGEKIKVATFPYDFKGFIGMRNFYIEDERGEKIAFANSIWTLMNLETERPNRLLPEMVEGYVLEEKLPMDYAPRKIAMPEGYESQSPIEIKPYHLDTNHHVNNGQYLRIAMEYVEKDFAVRRMRAEYKKSALLGNQMIAKVAKEYGKYTISLCNEAEEVYAIVELSR
ncbi:MAG: thioesterase [Lachnospiraceae bacterium]|nr:thioesterase [Lachnospiraceae bacterium]